MKRGVLKVWGGLTTLGFYPQSRTLVCASSKREAVELLNQFTNVSLHCFNDYWGETGNALELATATTKGVWANTLASAERSGIDPKFKRITRLRHQERAS